MFKKKFIFIFFLFLNFAHASADLEILAQIKEDLKNIPPQGSFSSIIDRWSHHYGSKAFEPLLKVTQDLNIDENNRYITLMAMVKIGGFSSVPALQSLLTDASWNIKVGALKAMRMLALTHPDEKIKWNTLAIQNLKNLLQDKALVVRNETVMTIETLQINGLTNELLQALHSHENYHKGKPLWVPQKILRALPVLEANQKSSIELLPLLENINDKDFLSLTISTLEKISLDKPTISEKASLQQKVFAWKNHLRKF